MSIASGHTASWRGLLRGRRVPSEARVLRYWREVAGDVEEWGEGAGGDGGVGGGRRACLHLFFVLDGRNSLL